jgi:hypothetical protein
VATFNYKLNLPTIIKVRIKVFYILLLKPVLKGILLKKKLEVKVEEEDFNINKVLNSQLKNGKLHYLIR